ncbi:MAG: AAC(3) family N-acetyltransferase [Candidatus Firestonebacteria bacterium]|nr:AAC(3) family N-acetyltransferase [Candidatus Firestonebacteria bacterium]
MSNASEKELTGTDKQAKNIVIKIIEGKELKGGALENASALAGLFDGKKDLFEVICEVENKSGKSIANKEELIEYFSKLKIEGVVSIKYRQAVTEERLLELFKKIGLKPKDKIMVHSSFLLIGGYMLKNGLNWKEEMQNSPALFIKVLMDLITEEGVIMMPSFNHGAPYEEGGPGYYSPLETPTTNGVMPDLFWRMKGVYRSIDPTHPFAVWGKNARDYVKNQHKLTTMGYDSPLQMIEKGGGKVLIIDAPKGNTFHHIVEMTNNAHCVSVRGEEYPVKLPDGKIVKVRTWGWREGRCKITDPVLYFKTMEERGLLNIAMIGKAKIFTFDMKDCRKVIEEYFDGKFEGYGCKICQVMPRVVPETVECDWDFAAKKVKSNTTAFIGECL